MNDHTYALITGASEGFGKSLAFECAQRGWNLILVSLPCNELFELGSYLKKEYEVSVKCYGLDLTDIEQCNKLFKEITQEKIAIKVLINNAGMGGTHFFKDRDPEFYVRQIRLNTIAPTVLTYLFLNDLEKNGPSFILNVASMAGMICLPLKQVYGGTKAYLLFFSQSLRRELKQKNISVSTVCPGGMNTNLQLTIKNRSISPLAKLSVLNPEIAAKIAIDGMLGRKEIIVPGYVNKFFMFFDKILPHFIKAYLVEKQLKSHLANKFAGTENQGKILSPVGYKEAV